MRVPSILRLSASWPKPSLWPSSRRCSAGAARPAAAADWPTRPVTLIIGFAAGSMLDFVGRAIADDLSAAIGQPVVVESKSGGGGVVSALYVAKAPPDGYTLLLNGVGPAVLRPLMDKSVGYDTLADFTPIILVGETPNVLVANPKLGVQYGQGSGRLCQVERRQDQHRPFRPRHRGTSMHRAVCIRGRPRCSPRSPTAAPPR